MDNHCDEPAAKPGETNRTFFEETGGHIKAHNLNYQQTRYGTGENATAVTRYTLAVDWRFSRRDAGDHTQNTDFIGCVAFGKSAPDGADEDLPFN